MKRFHSLKMRLWVGAGLAATAMALYAASTVFVLGEDAKAADAKPVDKPAATATAADAKAATAKPVKKVALKKLTGAELYAIHCNRCHAERYPTEWKSGEWKTLMTHMRVRANLPAAQAKVILKYLQEDSGS